MPRYPPPSRSNREDPVFPSGISYHKHPLADWPRRAGPLFLGRWYFSVASKRPQPLSAYKRRRWQRAVAARLEDADLFGDALGAHPPQTPRRGPVLGRRFTAIIRWGLFLTWHSRSPAPILRGLRLAFTHVAQRFYAHF